GSIEALEYLSETYNIPLEYEEYNMSEEEIKYQYLLTLNSAIVDFLNQNLINQSEDSIVKKYLYDRGITDEDIKKWKIGYGTDEEVGKKFLYQNLNGKCVEYDDFVNLDIVKNNFFTNKIIFPIFDNRGKPIGFSNRIFAYHIDKQIQKEMENKIISEHEKYKNTGVRTQGYDGKCYGSVLFKSKSSNLYGLHLAKQYLRKNNWTLILVEGNVDAISCHRYGINNVAALMGTAFNEDTIQIIKSCGIKKIIFCLDGDKGGTGGVLKIFENIQEGFYKEDINFIINTVRIPPPYDPDSLLNISGNKDFLLSILDKPQCISEFLIDISMENTELNTLSQKINFIYNVKEKLKTNRNLTQLEKKLILESLSEKLNVDKDAVSDFFKIEENKDITSMISEISEKIVLSELIFSDESRVTILSKISSNNYYYSRNRKLHELIEDLHSNQEPIDMNVIEIKSREKDYLDRHFDLEYLNVIKNIPRLNVDYHIDKIIELYQKRLLLTLSRDISSQVYASENMQELIGNFSGELYKLNFNKNEDIFKEPKQEAFDYYSVMAKRLSNPGKHYGILTGFKTLDEATQGFFPGQTILILARTSDGKTALGQNFARNIALEQTPANNIYYANLEMPSQDMMDRIISIDSGVPIRKVCSGMVNERQKVRILKSINNYGSRGTFHIQYTTDLTVSKLASILRYQIEVNHIKMAILDYVQLMSPDKEYIHAPRSEQLAAISRGITGLAKTLNIPIIIIAQANRTTVTDNAGRPELHHVFGTDQLAHDVDIAISLQPQTKGQMEKNGGFLAPDEMKYIGYNHLIGTNQDDYERYKIGRNGNYILHILKNRKGQKDFSYPLFFHKFKIKFQECADCMSEIQYYMNNSN
ncbi:MAG: toprim domain-containing protein, partial [Methanothrix sp.]|nr:toprim domain-containing protein [Methanothrix sp.]